MDSAVFFKYKEFRQLVRPKHENIDSFLQSYETLKEDLEYNYVNGYSTDQKDILEMLYVCNLDASIIEEILFHNQTKSKVRKKLLLLGNNLETRVGWTGWMVFPKLWDFWNFSVCKG